MNKNELIEQIAKSADISKAKAGETLDAFIETVTKSLKKKNEIRLIGFGTFSVSRRKATEGRNPRTGEKIKIAATNVPKFKPGKALKSAVN